MSSGVLVVAGATAATANAACSPSPGSTGSVCTFGFSPASTGIGSDPSITASIGFNYGSSPTDSVKSATITLPPGLLASLGAVPALCTTAALTETPYPACPLGSKIGSGTLTAALDNGGPQLTSYVTLYMMPPPSPSDVAGVGALVTLVGPPPGGIPLAYTTGTVSVTQTGGAPALQLSLPSIPESITQLGRTLGIQVLQMSFTINGPAPDLTGTPTTTPFTRLPTSCAPATSTLSVQTWSASSPNGSGTSTFTPTNCGGPGSPGFKPAVSAVATKDQNDPGVTLITKVNTNPLQAATKSLTLAVPSATLAPDVFNAAGLFNKVVGSVAANTTLLSSSLVGTVTLTGTIAQPMLTITFPPPFAITFSGSINLVQNSVTFSTVPDVPLSSMTVTLTGGPSALFYTNCIQPDGTLAASFVGQDGTPATAKAPLDVTGCPPPVFAKISGGSLTGVAKSQSKLSFGLTAGSDLPKLHSFTVSLPHGLSFEKSAVKQGVTLSGAKLRYVALKHGKLIVTLKSAAASFKVKIAGTALVVKGSLASKVKQHKVKSLTTTVIATNAKGGKVTLKLKLKPR